MTAASCSPSRYRSSFSVANASISGNSVVPGLPNMISTPSCLSRSRKARFPDIRGKTVSALGEERGASLRSARVSYHAGNALRSARYGLKSELLVNDWRGILFVGDCFLQCVGQRQRLGAPIRAFRRMRSIKLFAVLFSLIVAAAAALARAQTPAAKPDQMISGFEPGADSHPWRRTPPPLLARHSPL